MGVINMEDCTPLHYAAATGDANCCKFLAQRGAVRGSNNSSEFNPFFGFSKITSPGVEGFAVTKPRRVFVISAAKVK